MESPTVKPRRLWLAALLSLCSSGPLGQIYVGRLRRSLVLWTTGAILTLLASTFIWLPIGRFSLAAFLLCAIAFPVYLAVDALVIANRYRTAPLKPYQRWWVYLIAYFTFGVANSAVANVVRSFVVESFVNPTRAMSPTIQPGDQILVDRLWTRPTRLRRNDVVVFRSAGPNSPFFVMRVVGLPGDEIEIANEKVILNGTEWNDEHAVIDDDLSVYPGLANYGPILVPADSFFVLGDNRRISTDSRIIGPIPFSDLHGKARMIYWARERRFLNRRDTSSYELGPIGWSRIGARLD